MAEPSNADFRTQTSNGIIKGSPVLSVEDVSLEREIYKGRGYRLHTAKMSGKIVTMKVYEGSRARERCSEAARFNQKVIHPNIPQMIAVSPLKSDLSFLIFDGEYEGAFHDMLGQALKKDLKQILPLGLETVIGHSSGLDYLQDLGYPFASVGSDHFVVLSRKEKLVISFDPDDLSQINQSDYQLGVSNSAEVVFHELLTRTFDNACKANYISQQIHRSYLEEFDTHVDDLPENRLEELDLPSSSGPAPSSPRPSPRRSTQKLRPSGRRQELVWKSSTAETVTLNDISRRFQDYLYASRSSSEPALNRRRGRYTARTAHRCPGYNRIEITLTADITRSAIISHPSPIPDEICLVCDGIVKDTDIFNCICGGDDDEFMSTVRCTSCSEWHHRHCVGFLDLEPLIFLCERCKNLEQVGPCQPTHPRNAMPFPVTNNPMYHRDPRSFAYDNQNNATPPNHLPHHSEKYTTTDYHPQQGSDLYYASPAYAMGGVQDAKRSAPLSHTPNDVYRPQRARDKDGRTKNNKEAKNNKKANNNMNTKKFDQDEPASISFVVPVPRQHGRSASAPTPPLYELIQIPNVYHMIPSCPTSPSLLPMISRRSAHPGHPDEATFSFDYLPNNNAYIPPPSDAMSGQFEASLQSSEFLRGMFNTIGHGASAPSLQEISVPSSDALPLPAHQIVSTLSALYTPPQASALLSQNYTHLAPDTSPEAQAQAEMDLQMQMQMQPEFAAYNWESSSMWSSGSSVLLSDDWDINAIRPIELGMPKYTKNIAVAATHASGLEFGQEFVHPLEGVQCHDEDHNLGLLGLTR
ncbi:hypothetical protein BDZ97DRAFT_514398 [Flammula alnicola]|nr:hypothetical protein BDZ97DRAFT_514398 [Flammula alnicola]